MALRRGARASGVALASVILACVPPAFALDSALDVSQYVHTSWKAREGLTSGTIRSFAQTQDGYLWLGTDRGLVRFDGVRAVAWQPPAGQRLPSNGINDLLVADDGTLWIGTTQGVASWKNGQLTRHDSLAGSFVSHLL